MNQKRTNFLLIGDNQTILESPLARQYLKKIKLIYIDPPYNTNSAKSYDDKTDSGKWLATLEKILRLLREYLAENGCIFISIDDNEYASLKLACDKIFSKDNFLGTFITRQSQRSNSKFINTAHEYILCYAKNKNSLERFSVKRMDIPEQRAMIKAISGEVKKLLPMGRKAAEKRLRQLIGEYCEKYEITWLKNYNRVDDDGNIYFASDLSVPGEPREVSIKKINLRLAPLKTRGWVSDKKFIELHSQGALAFRGGRPYQKNYLGDASDNAPSILNFYSRFGTKDLEALGLRDVFDTPKPVQLIKFLIRIANLSDGDIVMDCYAGSGTTGQAVMEINNEDGKAINFILIQKKEPVSPESKAFGRCGAFGIEPYISEIIKLRLKRVIEKSAQSIDLDIIEPGQGD
ncbi:MAG: site-specific DNA-methyltransferase [Desulfovibrio sp.]|nr:site-specific DNA-methyltransferase [Desulfovibrio sp.]